jgi:hypothetical protein
MAYEDYGYDPMGNTTGYVDQEAQAIALREEEEKKRKEAEERARKENERLAKERDNLAVHKQEVTTYANGSKTITNVAEVPATANAPGRPNVKPVAPQGFQGQTDEFGGVDAAVERQRRMNQGQPGQQPRAPVVPVAPGNLYQSQLQAESGNRQIDPRTGQIMTSPKGALGIAQIMPATAMQPGYGVPDIFTLAQQRGIPVTDRSEATAKQLLANKDLNQEFGQNYSNAMRERFGDSAGVAAYNAGPGAVERNMGRNQGQFNVAQAPQETQGYLDKVMRGVGNVVNAVIPSAQAGTLQQPPANVGSSGFQAYDRNRPGNAAYEGAPVAQPFQGQTDEFGGMEEPRQVPTAPVAPDDSVINNQVADYERRQASRAPNSFDEFGTPVYSEKQATLDTHLNAYGAGQDDPISLMRMGSSDDPSIPDWLKERSRHRAADLVNEQRGLVKAKETVATMSPEQTAKVLRKKTDEGSAIKMFIYNMLGMTLNAYQEADKLGLGKETAVIGSDGKPYLIKTGFNGKPLSGYNPETQKDLTEDELITVAAGATDMKNTKAHMMADAKGSPVTKTIDGKLVNGIQVYDPVRKTFVVKYGNKTDEQPEGWTSASQNVEQQAVLEKQKAQIDLYKKFEGASIDAKFKYIEDTNKALVAKFGTGAVLLTPEEFGLSRPSAGGRVEAVPPTAMPAGTTGATQAPPGTSVAPGQLPAATQASGVPATTAGGQKPPTLNAMKTEEAQTKINQDLGKTSSEGVIKHRDEKLVPAADGGQTGSDIVKRQFNVMNDPRSDVLFGLYNKAQLGSKNDKNWAIVRDVIGGKLDSKDTEVSKAIAQVKLDPDEFSLLTNLSADNAALATATIKSGGFGAQVSDRDRVSAEKMQLNVGEVPALGMYNGKAQQLFGFDLSRAKSDWASGKKFEAVDQLEKAWRQEQTRLVEQYGKVADERNAFIKANSDGKAATIGLVRESYKRYPVPQYDPNLNNGSGGWRNMRDRKLSDILKGNQ